MDRTVTFKQEETSGHEPQTGLDTKTDRLTDRQLQSDFEFDFDLSPDEDCSGEGQHQITWTALRCSARRVNGAVNTGRSEYEGSSIADNSKIELHGFHIVT
jgi:hypothetical protein